jgi:metal-responsive CopG/Arc/MetJ family transcriptional regulator
MRRTTVSLPDDLKAQLERTAAETGRTKAEIIRHGVRWAVAQHRPPRPATDIFVSDDPHFAERVDDYLVGLGEQ